MKLVCNLVTNSFGHPHVYKTKVDAEHVKAYHNPPKTLNSRPGVWIDDETYKLVVKALQNCAFNHQPGRSAEALRMLGEK